MTSFAPSSALVLRRKIRPRRRKSISVLQLVLPALALITGGAIATQVAIRATKAKTSITVASAPLRMESPRFTGTMKDGREFLIIATAAIRDNFDPNKVALEAPELIRGYGSENPTRVVAKQGNYDEAKGALLLTGQVEIENGDGYAFKTEKAVIDTRTGELMGDAGVEGAASGAQVKADSYSVTDKGDRVIFKGRVRSRLNPGH